MMTPRERVEAALRGHEVDRIPFTVYETKIPQCETERRLRNEGLCIIDRRIPGYEVKFNNVEQESVHFRGKDGIPRIRTIIHTPVGDISALERPAPRTSWSEEKLFKSPADYAPIEYMIRDQDYLPNYDAFLKAQQAAGGDVFFRATIGYSPLQEIIYGLMGVEQFSIEWAERRDKVMRLYDALTENRRKIYAVVAESPALAVNYCGNVSPEVVGRARFEKYILPHYNECAEIMHKHGKLLGVHLDANNRLLAPLIADSKIDYIEAFTPPPDCDMSVAEARRMWPDKVLWINFPSSVHLAEPSVIEETTRQILKEAAPGDRFLLGITEDVPPDRWQQNFSIISRVINTEG
ncbi:MAG: hypothetical protein CVU38_01810 [Chloroflexi bacterium HGW-Chloroflexi-1]|nr:MAG: hypothetical protein CVU38_01810 [Chloroflexi bacterium HGW-Chloroflexi-1]